MSMAIASSASDNSIHPQPLRVATKQRTMIRRRPTLQQGRALELLGHAVEYLVDSRLYLGESDASDQLAVQTLMRLNREVFAECAEVAPKGRLRQWLGW